jgi:hypothetical protein
MEELKLCFIKYIGEDIDGLNIYEFLFTDKIDEFWGENFEYFPSCLCNELIPDSNYYSLVKKIKTNLKLNLVQNSCCFSYQDSIDGIVAIAYEDISNYESYPEDGRLILHYGITFEDTEELLHNKNISFQ